MSTQRFEFEVTGRTTSYLKLPHWDDVQRTGTRTLGTMTLPDLMGAYEGPYVVFDIDKATGVLVGIEVITEDDDEEEIEDDEEIEARIQKMFRLTGQLPAYLRLLTHTDDVKPTRGVTLRSLVQAYKGPKVVLDFDEQSGVLVGIKISAEEDERTPASA